MAENKTDFNAAERDFLDALEKLEDAHDMQLDVTHRVVDARFRAHLVFGRGPLPSSVWGMLGDADDAIIKARLAVDEAMDAIGRAARLTQRAASEVRWQAALLAKAKCCPLSVSYRLHVAMLIGFSYCDGWPPLAASGDTCGPAGQYIATPAEMAADGDRCALIGGSCA